MRKCRYDIKAELKGEEEGHFQRLKRLCFPPRNASVSVIGLIMIHGAIQRKLKPKQTCGFHFA